MYSTIIIYTLISFSILLFTSIYSYKLYLVDRPNKRKVHSKPTAFTGGLAISFAYIISIKIFNIQSYELNLILSIAFLITIVGTIDDKYHLNIGGKLSLQIIPVIYLIVIEKLNLNQIGNYNYFELSLNSFSIPFTLLSVLLLINSFNYFDGLDGTLSFTSVTVLMILFYLIPNEDFRLFLIIIFIPLFIFILFNFSTLGLPKLFLGDGGSLLLGFLIAFFLIHVANQSLVHPILLAWSIVIFVYEFLSINLLRIINKKKIFNAGLDHLHHISYKKTKSIFFTNLFISLLNLTLFIIGYMSFKIINPFISLMLFIIFFMVFFTVRKKYSNIRTNF